MTATRTTDRRTDWTAVVGVRVPRTDSGDLATCASRRLARAEGIRAVTAARLRGIEPALAATAVTLAVAVRCSTPTAEEDVAAVLAGAPGVQRVDEVEGGEF